MNREQMLEIILKVTEEFKCNKAFNDAILLRIPYIINIEGYDKYKPRSFDIESFDMYREVIVSTEFKLLEKDGKLIFTSTDSDIAVYIDIEIVFTLLLRALTVNRIDLNDVCMEDIIKYFNQVSEIEYYKIVKSKCAQKIKCSCGAMYLVGYDIALKFDGKYFKIKPENRVFKNINVDTMQDYVNRTASGNIADIDYLENMEEQSLYNVLISDFDDGMLFYNAKNEQLILPSKNECCITYIHSSLIELGFALI